MTGRTKDANVCRMPADHPASAHEFALHRCPSPKMNEASDRCLPAANVGDFLDSTKGTLLAGCTRWSAAKPMNFFYPVRRYGRDDRSARFAQDHSELRAANRLQRLRIACHHLTNLPGYWSLASIRQKTLTVIYYTLII